MCVDYKAEVVTWNLTGEIPYILLSMGSISPGPVPSFTMLLHPVWNPGFMRKAAGALSEQRKEGETRAEPCVLAFGTLPLPLLEWPFKSSTKADSMQGESVCIPLQVGHTARTLDTSCACYL